jgi:hypothetical protein
MRALPGREAIQDIIAIRENASRNAQAEKIQDEKGIAHGRTQMVNSNNN